MGPLPWVQLVGATTRGYCSSTPTGNPAGAWRGRKARAAAGGGRGWRGGVPAWTSPGSHWGWSSCRDPLPYPRSGPEQPSRAGRAPPGAAAPPGTAAGSCGGLVPRAPSRTGLSPWTPAAACQVETAQYPEPSAGPCGERPRARCLQASLCPASRAEWCRAHGLHGPC